jgi:hypothetical protein
MTKEHRFQVVIEGIDLDSATADRLRLAVQRAALRELADLDYHGDVAARIGNGGTQGITIVALTEDQARGVGLRGAESERTQP